MSGPQNPLAFPNPAKGPYVTDGMTLRDWFAGQALAGFLAGTAFPAMPESVRAKTAYDMADAMLAERDKETDQ